MSETYRLEFVKDYAYAHRGINVERFSAGQLVETESKELYEYALRSGCAVDPREEKEDKQKKSKKAV